MYAGFYVGHLLSLAWRQEDPQVRNVCHGGLRQQTWGTDLFQFFNLQAKILYDIFRGKYFDSCVQCWFSLSGGAYGWRGKI